MPNNELDDALARADEALQRRVSHEPQQGRRILAQGPTADLRARLPLWLWKKIEERAAQRSQAKSSYIFDLVLRDLTREPQ